MAKKIALLNVYWDRGSDADTYVCANANVAADLLLRLCQEHYVETKEAGLETGDYPNNHLDLERYLEDNQQITAEILTQPLVATVKLLKQPKNIKPTPLKYTRSSK